MPLFNDLLLALKPGQGSCTPVFLGWLLQSQTHPQDTGWGSCTLFFLSWPLHKQTGMKGLARESMIYVLCMYDILKERHRGTKSCM